MYYAEHQKEAPNFGTSHVGIMTGVHPQTNILLAVSGLQDQVLGVDAEALGGSGLERRI